MNLAVTARRSTISQRDIARHLLRQGWTCASTLHDEVGWRYAARVHEIRREGLLVEDRPCDCPGGDVRFKHYRIAADGNQRSLF